MKNITLSMSESLIEKARRHAQQRGTTLNQLIRDLVAREVEVDQEPRIMEFFKLADSMDIRFKGGFLTREEANERR